MSEDAHTPTAPTFLSVINKRRPPPLQLRSFGPAFSSSFEVTDGEQTPLELSPVEDYTFDQPSLWPILNAFPSPPTHIPRSRTSISISKILRRGGNNTFQPTPVNGSPKFGSRVREGEQDENQSPTPRPIRKRKGHASFGSLGKGFRAGGTLTNQPFRCMRPSFTFLCSTHIRSQHPGSATPHPKKPVELSEQQGTWWTRQLA
jgi:hypothetical protein